MNQVQKPSARLIVRLVIAVCLLGTMPTITAHPKSAKAATEYAVGSPGPAGGIVFYVATTPFKCGVDLTAECTYLEAAPNDWNSGIGSDPMLTWGVSMRPTLALKAHLSVLVLQILPRL